MSSPAPSFNPQTFLDQVGSFNYVVDPSVDVSSQDQLTVVQLRSTPIYTGLMTEWKERTTFGGADDNATFELQLDGLLSRMDAANTNPAERILFPNSWSNFLFSFRSYFGIGNNASLGIDSSNPRSGPAFNGYLQSFETALQTGASPGQTFPATGLGSDWSALGASEIQDQFVNSFGGFLAAYPFTPSTDNQGNVTYPPETTQTFLNNYLHFISVTAVNEAVTLATSPEYASLLTYQQAYKAFFPNSTQQDFDSALAAFADEVENDSADGGYFNPSQHFARFFTEIKNKFLVLLATQGTLQANKGVQLAILWQVFALITSMVQSIQKVTAISAQRLGYLTNLQQAYTNLINSIPTFLNGQPFSSDDTGPINAKNQAFAQNLRSYSDLVGSASKSLQSNVSALNDATNTQANLITSIIQQMSTLISAIAK